jgi:hypothetical protein
MDQHSVNEEGGRVLDRVIADYLEAVEAEETPDPADWLARYPSIAEGLRQFLADQNEVLRWTEPIHQAVTHKTSPWFGVLRTGPHLCGVHYLAQWHLGPIQPVHRAAVVCMSTCPCRA